MMTLPFNIASRCPVLTVPSGRSSDGVPTGLAVVGKTYDDVTAFRVAAAHEERLPWLDLRPAPAVTAEAAGLALMTGRAAVPARVPGHAGELAGPAVQPVGVPACPRADPDRADRPGGRPGPAAARGPIATSLALAFPYGDRELTVAELLDDTFTDGFLVLHRGQVVAEHYFNGMAPDVPHLLMSVSKSVTAAVAGILAGRGRAATPAPRSRTIVPELAGTSFARRDGAAPAGHAGRDPVQRGLRRSRRRRAHLRAGVPVAAADRRPAAAGRARATSARWPTTGRTAARSGTARSSPTCWPG